MRVYRYPYFEDEVWRRARSHCGSEDPVMVRVDQRLVQVQHQNLPLYCIWSLLRDGTDTCDTLFSVLQPTQEASLLLTQENVYMYCSDLSAYTVHEVGQKSAFCSASDPVFGTTANLIAAF